MEQSVMDLLRVILTAVACSSCLQGSVQLDVTMNDALPDQDGCAASSTTSPWSKTVVGLHVIMFEMKCLI